MGRPPCARGVLVLLTLSFLLAVISVISAVALTFITIQQLVRYGNRLQLMYYMPIIAGRSVAMGVRHKIADMFFDSTGNGRWGRFVLFCLSLLLVGYGLGKCIEKRWERAEVGGDEESVPAAVNPETCDGEWRKTK
jgi:Na+-transporting methylmalonyl-CoA/oxaloacetate decarboxylase gamma subunit